LQTSTETRQQPGRTEPGLIDDVKSLWTETRGLAYDHLKLAALETKLAGESLVSMIAAGVVVAVLLVTAWLGLVAAGVLALIDSGVLASVAMLLAVALNVVVAVVLFGIIRSKSQNLRWAATLRSLKPRSQAPTAAPRGPEHPAADAVDMARDQVA